MLYMSRLLTSTTYIFLHSRSVAALIIATPAMAAQDVASTSPVAYRSQLLASHDVSIIDFGDSKKLVKRASGINKLSNLLGAGDDSSSLSLNTFGRGVKAEPEVSTELSLQLPGLDTPPPRTRVQRAGPRDEWLSLSLPESSSGQAGSSAVEQNGKATLVASRKLAMEEIKQLRFEATHMNLPLEQKLRLNIRKERLKKFVRQTYYPTVYKEVLAGRRGAHKK